MQVVLIVQDLQDSKTNCRTKRRLHRMNPLLGGVGVGSCTGHRAQGTEHRGKNGMRLAACG